VNSTVRAENGMGGQKNRQVQKRKVSGRDGDRKEETFFPYFQVSQKSTIFFSFLFMYKHERENEEEKEMEV
jgi:hypothetical protein